MLINPTKFIANYLNQISEGYLVVLFPDGSKKSFGDINSDLQTELHIRDNALLKNLLFRILFLQYLLKDNLYLLVY